MIHGMRRLGILWFDATYGAGTVVVTSALTPVGQPAPTSG